MKRLILSLTISLALTLGGVAQSLDFNFDDGTLQGWTVLDGDGDGHNWQPNADGMGHFGSDGMVLSYSKDPVTGDSLTPNEYLVSPRMVLDGDWPVISFFACALDEIYPAEHFGVSISTTVNDDPLAFTLLSEWTLTAKDAGNRQGNWYQRTVDLSAYAGQEVYVAIRHHYCSGQSAICIDDIHIEGEIVETQHVWRPIGMDGEFLGVSANGNMFTNMGYSGMFRSQDEGETWEHIDVASYVRKETFMINEQDRIFIFDENTHKLCYSDDNGDSWQEQTSGISTNWPLGMFSLSNDTIFICSREKFHWTLDGGESWDETPFDFIGEANFGSILADHAGNVYASTYSWTYPVEQVGIYTATLDDMTHWTVKSSGGASQMAFDSEGYILATGLGSAYFENGIYWVNADRFALTDDDIIFAMKRVDWDNEALFYSTDHGQTYTQCSENIPSTTTAPDPDLGLYKGRDNHLYCHGDVWEPTFVSQYYKSIQNADEIITDSPTPYHPIVEDGKQWNVLFSYPWSPPEPQHKYTDIYKIEGDTLLDGVSYKVMYTTRNENLTGWNLWGFLRETEDGQVFSRRPSTSDEQLLYDFSKEVGDTICMCDFGYDECCMVVIEKGEILVNGEPRQQIVLEYPFGSGVEEVWIEGIGSLFGIIDSGSLFLTGGSTNLLCYYEDGDLVWQNTTPGYNECYMVYPTPPTPPEPSQGFVEGWLEIPTGATENLYGVACLNGLEVVACGENGKILKTTNGGDSWTVKFEKEGYDMVHVAFADEQVGYACGDSCYWDVYHHKGIIVKTTDGGETWQELPNTNFVYLEHPDFQRTNDLFVVDAETFYLLTADNLLWKTTDSGQSFVCSASFEPLGRIVHCELYFKDETGYLVAINSDCVTPGIHIYKTTDSGQNWDEVYFNEYIDHTVATHFFDENHVELFGNFNLYQYNLMVTEDGFETVSYLHVATPIMTAYGFGNVSHSKFTSDTYGCVLMGMTLNKGSNETEPFILKDGWEHCEYVHVGIPYCYNDGVTHCRDLYDIDGIDTTFFIAAENGYVYKTAMIPLGGNNFLMGSEWYYEIENENGSITYQYMYQAGDTIVQDEPTHILVRINTLYDKGLRDEVTHEYVYKRDNKVYWWNKTLEEFTMLYDFEAEVGDEWEIKVGTESLIMHVDAVEVVEYEGDFYRMLRVSDVDDYFSGDIVCGIGHLTSFFPERLMDNGDGLRVEGLRCYWIGDELVFKLGDEDCDAVYSEVHGVEEEGPSAPSTGLVVYPNPTDGVLFVETRHGTSLPDQTYRITNLMGQTLQTGQITAETQQIDVSDLPEGMYFITFAGETRKFVVNK